jgi:hypothetical protein
MNRRKQVTTAAAASLAILVLSGWTGLGAATATAIVFMLLYAVNVRRTSC